MFNAVWLSNNNTADSRNLPLKTVRVKVENSVRSTHNTFSDIVPIYRQPVGRVRRAFV